MAISPGIDARLSLGLSALCGLAGLSMAAVAGFGASGKAVTAALLAAGAVLLGLRWKTAATMAVTGELVKLTAELGERTQRTLEKWRTTLGEEKGAHEEALDTALDAVREGLRTRHQERESEVDAALGVLLDTFARVAQAAGELGQCADRVAEEFKDDRREQIDARVGVARTGHS